MLISKANNGVSVKCQNANVRYVFNGKNLRIYCEYNNR